MQPEFQGMRPNARSDRGVTRHRIKNFAPTPIHVEMLQHRANGKSVAEIKAMYPRLGPNAVRGQFHELFKKMEARNCEHAVALAFRQGLIR